MLICGMCFHYAIILTPEQVFVNIFIALTGDTLSSHSQVMLGQGFLHSLEPAPCWRAAGGLIR